MARATQVQSRGALKTHKHGCCEHSLYVSWLGELQPAPVQCAGPNTGGMGAYSPAPVVTPDIEQQVMHEIVQVRLKDAVTSQTP